MREEDGSNMAYYFSTPIYKMKRCKLVTPRYKRIHKILEKYDELEEFIVSQTIDNSNNSVNCKTKLDFYP